MMRNEIGWLCYFFFCMTGWCEIYISNDEGTNGRVSKHCRIFLLFFFAPLLLHPSFPIFFFFLFLCIALVIVFFFSKREKKEKKNFSIFVYMMNSQKRIEIANTTHMKHASCQQQAQAPHFLLKKKQRLRECWLGDLSTCLFGRNSQSVIAGVQFFLFFFFLKKKKKKRRLKRKKTKLSTCK